MVVANRLSAFTAASTVASDEEEYVLEQAHDTARDSFPD